MTDTLGERAPRRMFHEAARYVIAGGAITIFYLACYALLLFLGVQYFLAILIVQAATISIAFPTYRRFVFGPGTSLLSDFIRFLSVWLGGMVAGLIGTPVLVEFFSWNPLLGQLASIVIVTAANFLIHRFWTFPRKPTAENDDSAPHPL